MNDDQYASLLRRYVRGVVYNEMMMSVTEFRKRGEHICLTIKLHVDDFGLFLGRECRNIKALRLIFDRIGEVDGQKIYVAVDSHGNRQGRHALFVDDSWDKTDEAIDLAGEFLSRSGYRKEVMVAESTEETFISFKTDAPPEFVEALHIVMRQWGKSQGRLISINQPIGELKVT